ncbi:MAG: HAD family hydrolase [Spirochaetales bacterium]|nr:HAD family hydrolase [Spirochaetales bacterium]
MLQAVIFDLDGTLLNTIADITSVINRGLALYNLPQLTIQACATIVGEGIEKLVRRALPPGFSDEKAYNTILSSVKKNYQAAPVGKTTLYPGVGECLDYLARKKIPMAILSNKPHDIAVQSVAGLLADWQFVRIQGALEGSAPKPEKSAALNIAAQMQKSPDMIAFIGDSEIDIQTARNAGMYAVAVTWGFRSRELLSHSGPDIIVDSPAEIIELFAVHEKNF